MAKIELRFIAAEMSLLVRSILLGAFAVAGATPACAADEDAQLWLTTGIRAALAPQIDGSADIVIRLSDDRGGVGQAIGRASLSYRISDSISVEGVYGYFVSYDDGNVTQREHRPAQSVIWRMGEAGGGQWTARLRAEQRKVEGTDEIGFRVRPRIGYSRPLAGTVALNISSEAFISLNDTSFGAQSGFNGLRNTTTVAVPVNEHVSVEISYLNQWSHRRRRTDTIVHAATATLLLRL